MERTRAPVMCAMEWVARLRASPPSNVGQRPALECHDPERGQGLAEYALILSLIAIVAIVAVAFLGETLNSVFLDPIGTEITKVLNGI